MRVGSPKTERCADHAGRIVSIVPRLRALLLDAFEHAEEGQQGVLRISRNHLQRVLYAAIKRAEIAPIGRVFQTCRQSCETDWARTYPGHVAAAWLGHSEDVSRKHYLTIPEDVFDAAAGMGDGDLQATERATDQTGTGTHGRETVESATNLSQADETAKQVVSGKKPTAPRGTRTHDPLIKNQLLCQLS